MHKFYFLTPGLLSLTLLAQAQTIAPASRVQQRILAADSVPTLITFRAAAAYKATEATQALREQLHLSPVESIELLSIENQAYAT